MHKFVLQTVALDAYDLNLTLCSCMLEVYKIFTMVQAIAYTAMYFYMFISYAHYVARQWYIEYDVYLDYISK